MENKLARLRRLFGALHADEGGQALTEYVVLICSIALVSITAINLIADQLIRLLEGAFEGLDIVATNLD
ncbi:MAG: hypothetical protein GY898_10550 [Proteobacteria bacterium]|nr:hypothetical protein [Pseudomonadota bacterium]